MGPPLSAVIENQCYNFIVDQLHDTKIVVEFDGLFKDLRRRQKPTHGYGVGLFHLASHIKHVISAFQQCKIEPFFVFHGISKSIPTKWNRKVNNLKRSSRSTSIPETGVTPDYFVCKSANCSCSCDTLTAVLDEINVKYIFIDGYSVGAVAAIAVELGCPLVGGGSLYYTMTHNTDATLKYYPISGMSFTPVEYATMSDGSREPKFFLECHLYNPTESLLSNLSPGSCSIFAILWGETEIPHLEIPADVIGTDNDRKSEHRRKAVENACKIIEWINRDGSQNVMEKTLGLITDEKYKDLIIKCLPMAINRRRFGFEEALRVLNAMEHIWDSDGTGYPPVNEKSDSQSRSESVLGHWPASMMRAYHLGLVCPFLLSALYSSKCKTFSCNLDYIAALPSSYLKGLPVRYVTYSLMYSFELSIGGCQNLQESDSRLLEVHRMGTENVKIVSIPLFNVPLHNAPFGLEYIYKIFSYTPRADLAHGINLLALCLLIWYQQKCNEMEELRTVSPSECPVVLAVCICALAQVFNAEEHWADVNDKYEKVCEAARNEACGCVNGSGDETSGVTAAALTDDSGLPRIEQSQWLIHSLVEIQNVYTEMIALTNFVRALTYAQGKIDAKELFQRPYCRATHQVFTSNKLFYWLVKCLQAVPAKARDYKALRCWLPRLFINSNNTNVSEKCIAVVTDLVNLLQHLRNARIQLPPIQGIKEGEVSISRLYHVSKNCIDVREKLECFLTTAKANTNGEKAQMVTSAVVEQPVQKSPSSLSVAPPSISRNGDGDAEQHPQQQQQQQQQSSGKSNGWKRGQVITAESRNGASRTLNRTPTKWRRSNCGGSKYAEQLKRRVGIE